MEPASPGTPGRLNFRQRRMLAVVAVATTIVLLCPPVNVDVAPGVTGIEFVWLFERFDGTIDFPLLIAEVLSLCLIGLVACRVVETR